MTTEDHELQSLQQAALRNYWLPTQPWNEIAEAGPSVATEGEGVRIKVNGRWGYDAMAGLILVNIGHGRKTVVDAISDQLSQLHYGNTFAYPAPAVIRLAEKVASLTPGDLNRTYFTSGGAEAVETN